MIIERVEYSMATQKKDKGFTIIEVVLVLAIAGLIFLMVFIALPAMQRGQRDQSRKTDVNLVATAVTNYTGSNRGNWPSQDRLREYVDTLSGNSDKEKLTINTSKPTSVAPEEEAIMVVTSMKCGESSKTNQALTSGSSRQFVVVTKLEAGGGSYFCQES